MAKAAMKTMTQMSSGRPLTRAWNIQPTNPSATACTAVPMSSNGRRPARSTNAMATNVKARFTSPTHAVEVKAAFCTAPADWKILVE